MGLLVNLIARVRKVWRSSVWDIFKDVS